MVMTDPTQGEGVVAALPEPVHFPYGSHYFDGSTSARPDDAPWLEWAGPGTYYKLLHLDADTGFMVFLLKLDPGIPGVVHKHYGAAMGFPRMPPSSSKKVMGPKPKASMTEPSGPTSGPCESWPASLKNVPLVNQRSA